MVVCIPQSKLDTCKGDSEKKKATSCYLGGGVFVAPKEERLRESALEKEVRF